MQLSLPAIADGEDKSSMLCNRVRKNYRHVRKWAKRSNTNCFRIYDRDIGKYPLAIDYYAGRFFVHYFPRRWEDDEPPLELKQEAEYSLATIFEADPSTIIWRSRFRREKSEQYEKLDDSKEFFNVVEYGVQFRINLTDYLDTGLFLDHREMRRFVSAHAKGKRLLNLFAYTCSFSVHAAMQGASYTKSVDMSNTYTAWGKENFLINNLSLDNNEIVRADCMRFFDQEIASHQKYDIIVIDPPTISRSKKMENMFDVQLDYPFLITKALNLLSPGGVIYFSTNSRHFTFDETLFPDCTIWNVSSKTIPLDFHDPKIHHCWKISRSI